MKDSNTKTSETNMSAHQQTQPADDGNVDLPESSTPDQSQEHSEVAKAVLEIIFEHTANKFDATQKWLESGTSGFLTVIDTFVSIEAPIEACLPAFPFKSANKEYKVLGALPDKAEELALGRLNEMCDRIKEIYPPGASVMIISDGITYNDLLCIPDKETWAYGEALRNMAIDHGFDAIKFSRMKDILDIGETDDLTEVEYVANCTNFRRLLLNKFGSEELDIDKEIASNHDTKLTYLGYRRFLESDLRHIFPQGCNRGSNAYKRDCKYIAKQMLARGYAFAGAIKNAFPNHLRLSIHQSMSGKKIPISLLNTKTGYTTPWHCSICQLADGEWISAPMGEFQQDERLEIVEENGQPSHFQEKSLDDNEGSLELPFNEFTASYIQEATTLTANGYMSEKSTPPTDRASSTGSSSAGGSSPASQSSPTMQAPSPVTTIASDASEDETSEELKNISKLSSPESSLQAMGLGIQEPYSQRLLPNVMDQVALNDPDRVVFSITSYESDQLIAQSVSAKQFVNAVDRAAWLIESRIGKSDSVKAIGYIGPHDLRHIILTYACVKAGYAALFMSPKINADAASAILDATGCSAWATAGDTAPIPMVKEVWKSRSIDIIKLPSLEDMLSPTPVEPYQYDKKFEDVKDQPFCYLHTSGTTGNPKPIPWSHALIGTMDAVRLLPSHSMSEGSEALQPWTAGWDQGNTIYSSFPMSHGAGVIMDILMPGLFDLQCILGPVGVLPNISLIQKLAETVKVDIWSMVPTLVDELGESASALVALSRSKFICASGGPVNPISAGKVNDVIRVLNLTGTTEGLFIGNLWPSREDWFWFAFHPWSGFNFKEIEEGCYEHWIHRNEHADLFQGIFQTFPEKDSVNFKDLYKQHPTKPNYWAFIGRSDDLIVLSNGYKIKPLDTESFVTTHPAIRGSLVFGTGKPQAGLLIDLKDPRDKNPELLDSIWETVKKANGTSHHKNQLLRSFVTFTEEDKPFVYTDKGTVKRAATLALYASYIDRFYDSRDDENVHASEIDLSSTESVQNGIKGAVLASLQEPCDFALDANFFEVGLDSLGVFAAVKALRVSTHLGEHLAPHYLYSNPTVQKLAVVIESLVKEHGFSAVADDASCSEGENPQAQALCNSIESKNGDVGPDNGPATKSEPNEAAELKEQIAACKSRQSFPLNAFDYVNPNHGMGLVFYLPLQDGATHQQAFSNLQDGLNRTFELIPALSGKVTQRSDQEFGYRKGDLSISVPPLSMAHLVKDRLVCKDLSDILPSFEELRQSGFSPSAFPDGAVLQQDPFPQLPNDIVVGQVSFVRGGVLLAAEFNHTCLDGYGAMVALKAWAENCRFLQGDSSATCSWFHPESFNHSLPEIIHRQKGWARPLDKIDQDIWNFLPFFPPTSSKTTSTEDSSADGQHVLPDGKIGEPTQVASPTSLWPLHSVWPLPQAERSLRTTLFLLKPEKLEALKRDVMASSQSGKQSMSASNIVQAFFWRAAIRARYRVRREIRKQTFTQDDVSVLELPTDGRPFFASLPSTYMGSLLLLNRVIIPVEELCAEETTIGSIVERLRQSTTRFTPQLQQDAFTVLQSLPDHSRFSTANMGVEHMNTMISNMMLFTMDELCFGSSLFANQGLPESMRPQIERGNGRFRFNVIYPMRPDGGLELVLGTHPEELEMLKSDKEFMRYAEFIGTSV